MATEARRTAEAAARTSYGRLLAFLSARSRDVAAAEDALAEAFRVALDTWPRSGVPDNPEAWLLTAARRTLLHGHRHAQVRAGGEPTLRVLAEEAEDAMAEARFPDERLKLLFVCAHPAIDPAARAPLMLQTVLGLDAARIASAFLVAPATMGQRLVRAKARIRDAGIAFQVPEPAELPGRLASVLEAVYAAYGSGWDDLDGADTRRKGLAEEALWLGRVLAGLLPGEPEARGLLALMLHCEARRRARRGPDGSYVPLEEQDTTLWDHGLAREAERELAAAAAQGRPGPFQLEAAIQSAHALRLFTGRANWDGIALLYEGLVRLAPTAGALVGRAAALAELRGPAAGLTALDALAPGLDGYQPYWALRAHLLSKSGHPAQDAYARAIGLAEDPAVRAWLLRRAGLYAGG